MSETRSWTVESVLGFLYSISFCSKEKLKDHGKQFEKELTKALLKINPKNSFTEETQISVIFAKKC